MKLVQMIYVSDTVGQLTEKDIASIMQSSQKNNPENGITGVLHYNKKGFIQCLEGGSTAVNNLYSRILSDRRHANSRIIFFHDIIKRDFGNWTMEYIGEGIQFQDIFMQYSTRGQVEFDILSGEAGRMFLLELAEAHREFSIVS